MTTLSSKLQKNDAYERRSAHWQGAMEELREEQARLRLGGGAGGQRGGKDRHDPRPRQRQAARFIGRGAMGRGAGDHHARLAHRHFAPAVDDRGFEVRVSGFEIGDAAFETASAIER